MTQSVFVVAEAGVNHNGDLAIAKQLVDVAAEAGVDAVKFQTFRRDRTKAWWSDVNMPVRRVPVSFKL